MVLEAGMDEAAVALGARVRALRREQRLTLKQLGRAAGLSHPFLSQVERGLARPSVASAERIASALGVRLASLWAEVERRDAEVVRRGAGMQESRCGATVRTLAADGRPLIVREWTSASRDWPEDRDVETGEVVLYVARGSVEVDLDGDVHALEEGDALLFDGGVPHRLRRTGGVTTRALRVAATL